MVVQIDESKFGKRKCHRCRRVNGVWVFGMIECHEQPDGTYKASKIVAYCVDRRNKQ